MYKVEFVILKRFKALETKALVNHRASNDNAIDSKLTSK